MVFLGFRKKIRVLGVMVIMMPMVALASIGATSFVDVPADHDFAPAITFLKEKEVVQGYPDRTFKPDATISRVEFLKIAMRMSGRSGIESESAKVIEDKSAKKNETAMPKGVFLDVHTDDWFYKDVARAQKLGIVSTAPQFMPNTSITRVQALKIAIQAFQFSPPLVKSSGGSDLALLVPPDISVKAWYFGQVMMARRLNILTDSDDGKFYPDLPVTRGMAAEILYRVQMSKDQQYAPVDITRGWLSFEKKLAFRLPKTWTAAQDGSRIVVLKRDPSLPLDYELVTPLSARLIINTTVLEVDETSDAYFDRLKELNRQAFPKEEVGFTFVTLMSQPTLHVKVPARGVEHWYIYLPNKTILSLYGRYGLSSLSLKLRESIRGIVRTLQVREDLPLDQTSELSSSNQGLRSDVQAKVLVEKIGKVTIDSLGDAIIFETDDIGVGTGPVDYYFSAKFNLTLKYERASDIILGVRNGKMSAF